MKIKHKINGCHISVVVRCGLKEKIALDEFNILAQQTCKGLMKIKEFKQKKAIYLGIKSIPLSEKLSTPITKREFFCILEQFLLIISNCDKTNIPVNSIVYDLKNVYFTETTKEIQLLFCPLKNNKYKAVPMDFIESLIYSSVPAQENDMEYITRFAYFLKTVTSFNVRNLETYIASEEPEVINFLRVEGYSEKLPEKPNIEKSATTKESLNSRIVEKELIAPSITNIKQHISRMDNSEIQDSDDDDTLYGKDEDCCDDMTLLNVTDDDETEMMYDDKQNTSRTPFLIRISTGETIKITKAVFRIGVKTGAVDYVVSNNNSISRSHADIICKNHKYYIFDLESKNKSYVNGRIIPSKIEFEIKNTDRIKLSNEEFIFKV